MRNTLQKDIVKSSIGNENDHPTAEEVYSRIHDDYPTISKATVYRILRQAADNDEFTRISMMSGADCYDKNTVKHYHVQCVKCGNIMDAAMGYHSDIDSEEEKLEGIVVLEHDILFKGVCKKCSK